LEFKLYAIEVLIGFEYNEPLIKVWSKPNTKINSDDKTTRQQEQEQQQQQQQSSS
jgi:hypothetical protein